jgi:hypothetical protein
MPTAACGRRWNYGSFSWGFLAIKYRWAMPITSDIRAIRNEWAMMIGSLFGLAAVYKFPFLIHGRFR